MTKKLKLNILISHPIQYFSPVFKEISKYEGVDLTVIYRTRFGLEESYDSGFMVKVKWDISLLNGYKYVFLSNKKKIIGFEWTILKELFLLKPDILLIHGYSSLTNWLAIIYSFFFRIRLCFRADSWLDKNSSKINSFKFFLKKNLFNMFDLFLCIGTLNRLYYSQHGVPEKKTFIVPMPVDNSRFYVKGNKRNGFLIRKKYNIKEDDVVLLYVSKLTKRKRPIDLLKAYSLLQNSFSNLCLLIVGSGEEEENLRQQIDELKLSKVIMAGFQNQSVLPNFYAAGDIFAFPAEEEPWGLVVNEAMASSLPVVVSNRVGCVPDLVHGNNVGFIYPCGDIPNFAKALSALVGSKALRMEMGLNAKKIIQNFDITNSTRKMLDVLIKK